MEQILFYKLSYLAVVVGGLGIGFFILFKKARDKFNALYILLNFTMVIWALGRYALLEVETYNAALFWARFLYIGSILVHLFFLHTILVFVNKDQQRRPLLIFFYSNCIFIFTLNLIDLFTGSNFFVKGVGPKLIFNYFETPNVLYNFHLINYLVIPTWAFIEIILALKRSIGIKRNQLKYILFSSVLGFIGGNSVVPLIYNISLLPIGVFLVPIHLFTITYAITRYRLTGILVIIRRSTVYALTVLTLAMFSLMLFLLIASFFTLTYNTLSLVVAIILLVISLTLFSPLAGAYTHFANKYFFAALYETEKVFQDLVKKIPAILNLDELLDLICQILLQTFKMEKLGIWFINLKKEAQALKIIGFTPNDKMAFVEDTTLLKYLEKTQKPLILQEAEQIEKARYDGLSRKFAKIKSQMQSSGAAIILPLIVKKELVGLAVLGPKLTAEAYTKEDVEMLEILANQSASALENAKLYTETQHFAETMKQEVIKATKDLRRLNQQLKRLDAAKSEFISIASHQLRTPLTAIKGYVSMVMDGDFGPVNKDLDEPLKRVYLSNQRLIDLVENLLNISRMESGRMQYYFEPVDLVEFVDGLVKDLQILADRKGIYLKYNKPRKPVTKFFADQEKLRQITMNLIDNAIKYTKVGGITITVKEEEKAETKEKKIIFIVEDTGMGIEPTDLPLLFQKFERGKGISLVHTEGTGLGLYVCKQLIEAHKGRVWAESEGKGKGSRFIAEFPILEEPPKVDTKPISPLGQPVVQIISSAKPTNLKKLPEVPEKR